MFNLCRIHPVSRTILNVINFTALEMNKTKLIQICLLNFYTNFSCSSVHDLARTIFLFMSICALAWDRDVMKHIHWTGYPPSRQHTGTPSLMCRVLFVQYVVHCNNSKMIQLLTRLRVCLTLSGILWCRRVSGIWLGDRSVIYWQTF